MNTKSFFSTLMLTSLLMLLPSAGFSQEQNPWPEQAPASPSVPLGTAFTYQGQLKSSGAPVNDTCDFEFSLWDAAGSGTPPTGGSQVGSTQPSANIPVSDGLFAVQLDFGSGAFTGEARWLQTGVRCPAGSGTYTTLAPRQALNPVPYALLSQDLSLPFNNGISSPLTAFSIWNNGTGLVAAFIIDNPLNTHSALGVDTNGSGSAGRFTTTGSGNGIWAETSGSGWAGNFNATGSGNGVRISAPMGNQGLEVVGGSKNAVVGTSRGARLLYTEESSAVWFTDYGFGHLVNGSVFITIDPLFAETVNLDEPYHVFVQAYGDAELYVSQRTPLGFEVRLRAGDPNVEFSYRLVATRLGYEGKRLEHAAWADNDPNLYPAQPGVPQIGGVK